VTVWFYDDIKDIIEICRVAAYLNHAIKPPFAAGNKFPSADYGLLPAPMDVVSGFILEMLQS